MRVTKAVIGKYVEITWRDPTSGRMELQRAPVGRKALSTWKERGVVDDVTEGVVRVVHSAGKGPDGDEGEVDEIQYTSIDETLIEVLDVYVKAETEPGKPI